MKACLRCWLSEVKNFFNLFTLTKCMMSFFYYSYKAVLTQHCCMEMTCLHPEALLLAGLKEKRHFLANKHTQIIYLTVEQCSMATGMWCVLPLLHAQKHYCKMLSLSLSSERNATLNLNWTPPPSLKIKLILIPHPLAPPLCFFSLEPGNLA